MTAQPAAATFGSSAGCSSRSLSRRSRCRPRRLSRSRTPRSRRWNGASGRRPSSTSTPSTGTPRVLARLDGTLTGAASGAPEDVAMSYVRAQPGRSRSDRSRPRHAASPPRRRRGRRDRGALAPGGRRHPGRRQRAARERDRDGRVLNVLGSPAPDLDPDTTPSLTPGEAVRPCRTRSASTARCRATAARPARPRDRVRRRQRRGADAVQRAAGLARDVPRVVDRGLRRDRRRRDRPRAAGAQPGQVGGAARSSGSATRVRRWAATRQTGRPRARAAT